MFLNVKCLKFKTLQKTFYKEKYCVVGYKKKTKKEKHSCVSGFLIGSLGRVDSITLMIEFHPAVHVQVEYVEKYNLLDKDYNLLLLLIILWCTISPHANKI